LATITSVSASFAPSSAAAAKPSADEIRDFVKDQVAAYKYPRRIWFGEQLPMGPTGKVLKREILVPEAAPN
jgi:long-chain acyl-CoA synthetase